jgi:hypothetical protein
MGERSDAVLRTAMPGHEENRDSINNHALENVLFARAQEEQKSFNNP